MTCHGNVKFSYVLVSTASGVSIMRIAVFGATGRTGTAVVAAALHRGHHVKAHCRDAKKFALTRQNLEVFESSFGDADTLRKVVEGSDAVVVAVGPRPPYREKFCEAATKQILLRMHETAVPRIVCVTGAMIGDPGRRSLLFERLKQSVARKTPEAFADRAAQEAVIRQSNSEWTIIKPPRLRETKARRTYQVGEQLKVGLLSSIGRKDLAEFILDEIEHPRFVRKAVVILHRGILARLMRQANPTEVLGGEFHVP